MLRSLPVHERDEPWRTDEHVLSVPTPDGGSEVLFPFGPPILSGEISPALQAILLRAGDEARPEASADYRMNLAGNFTAGTSCRLALAPHELDLLTTTLSAATGNYLSVATWFERSPTDDPAANAELGPLSLGDVWINYQRPGDFNPGHTHDGFLSFVIYLAIPPGPGGAITFTFGDPMDLSAHEVSVAPHDRQLLLFPARVTHLVWPFSADVERISVSGNLSFGPRDPA